MPRTRKDVQMKRSNEMRSNMRTYTEGLFQCVALVEKVSNGVIGHWKVWWQLFTTLDDFRAAGIQELRPEPDIGLPVGGGCGRLAHLRCEHWTEVVEWFPRFEYVQVFSEAQVPHSVVSTGVEVGSGFFCDMNILWQGFHILGFDEPREVHGIFWVVSPLVQLLALLDFKTAVLADDLALLYIRRKCWEIATTH